MRLTRSILLTAVTVAPLLHAQAAARRPQSLEDLSASLQALAARVRPGVVQIFSTGYATPQESDGAPASSLLSAQRSTGSGVILSADGYIVTNNHVVQGARRIEVRLPAATRTEARESTVPAKLVGADREADLAVIKIDRAGLPFLALAIPTTSSKARSSWPSATPSDWKAPSAWVSSAPPPAACNPTIP